MKSAPPEICTAALAQMSAIVDAKLAQTLEARSIPETARMYNMLRYFMGYVDADFAPSTEKSGKRFRPSLCLLLADAYDAREKALEAAVAIELFHNFTLVHDDVEDRDEYRRNRPTVWKLWGINHAINSGDVQSLIATEWITRAARHPVVGAELANVLVDAFIEVGEGQYLDFELSDNPLESEDVSKERYLLMTARKSGALVRVAAEAAGVAAGKGEEERKHLRDFGNYLGLAYQMSDDYRSVWATQLETGKDTHSDIREHKRTLPFLYAYEEVTGEARSRLAELYTLPRQLTEDEIHEVLTILETTTSKAKVLAMTEKYTGRAKRAAEALDLSEESREILLGIVDLLVPEGQKTA